MAPTTPVRETNLYRSPIRNLGLSIEGTPLAAIIQQFQQELQQHGITRVPLRCYLSTEWGVVFGSISIGIPFYLARPDLLAVHAEEVGHVEGLGPADILRYLRHEMGHVINYAYRLYEDEQWVLLFGSITQPYLEDYRPQPFSRRFVRHLPGWYAQKHPDEDWSETFAVWLTPQRDWRIDYRDWPQALRKLQFCDATMQRLRDVDPAIVHEELDEQVSELSYSVQEFYQRLKVEESVASTGLDGALRAIFDDLAPDTAPQDKSKMVPASKLIQRLQRGLMAEVFRWTGHFPERTRTLLKHLAERADALQQFYHIERQADAELAMTVFVTSLAMNYIHRGNYFPEPD